MIIRLILTILSIVGMASTFLPWIYYPKVDKYLYGYAGDGVISFIVFFIVIVFVFLSSKYTKTKFYSFSNVILSVLLVLFSISKFISFKESKENLTADNPLYSAASAGFELSSGVYVLTFASVFLLVFSVISLIRRIKGYSDLELTPTTRKYSLISIIILGALMIGYYLLNSNYLSPQAPNEIESSIHKDFDLMKGYLLNGDYEKYLEYTNPFVVEAIGGQSQMVKLLTDTKTYMDNEGIKIKSLNFHGIDQLERFEGEIQSVIYQELIVDIQGVEKSEIQAIIAISKDNGNSWIFANTNGKSMEEMRQIIPTLKLE